MWYKTFNMKAQRVPCIMDILPPAGACSAAVSSSPPPSCAPQVDGGLALPVVCEALIFAGLFLNFNRHGCDMVLTGQFGSDARSCPLATPSPTSHMCPCPGHRSGLIMLLCRITPPGLYPVSDLLLFWGLSMTGLIYHG